MTYRTSQRQIAASCLLFALALLSVMSIYVTQPIVTTIESHFRVPAPLASSAFTLASLGYSFALLFYSTLATKVGLKKIIVVASLFLGLTSLLIVSATNYTTFLGLRFFQGVFAAGIPALGMAYIHTVFAKPYEVHGIFVSVLQL